MLPNLGNMVYDIRASEQNWPGVGDKVTHKPRMGLPVPNLPIEWLSVVVHITDINPADIPSEGLSLYENGQTQIGGDRAWYLVRCTRIGGIRIAELSTEPPAHS